MAYDNTILARSRRWLRLVKKVAASNVGKLSLPYKLTYVVTKECHSRCVHCDIWKVKPKGELTLDEIDRFTRNNPFISWVDFTGGEPTDRDDLVDVVRTFLTNIPDMMFVHFPTNGLKTKRIVKVAEAIQLIAPEKFVVTVSLDGPEAINDQLRGIPGDFRNALETFKALRSRGVSVYLGMTLFASNVDKVGELISDVRNVIPDFRPSELHVNVSHISEHYYENKQTSIKVSEAMVATTEDVMRNRGLPLSPFALVEWLYQRQIRRYVESGVCPVDCAALMSSCFLSETGLVFPCSIWNEPLANIRDHDYSLANILASEKAKDLRKSLLAKDCPNCWTPCEAYQSIAANLLNPKFLATGFYGTKRK